MLFGFVKRAACVSITMCGPRGPSSLRGSISRDGMRSQGTHPHDIPWKHDSDNDFIWNWARGGSINSKRATQ